MIAVLVLIGVCIAIGYPLACWADVEDSRSGRIGLGFLLGSGTVATVAYALSFVQGGWSRSLFATTLAVVGAACWLVIRPWRESAAPRPAPPGRGSVILLVAAALVVGHALFATIAPPIEVDFLENWGLKGKIFWFAGGIDWGWLANDAMLQNHADYPVLLPMLYDALAILAGGWDDRHLGLLFTAFALALLLVTEAALRREHPERTVAVPIAMVALTPLALTPWIGLGEGPLIAFGSAAAHLLHRARVRGSTAAALMGGVLLGFGALTKNEGIALIVAAGLALVVAGAPRLVARLWPAVVLALLWIVPRKIFGLGTDLAAGDPLGRLVAQLASPGELVAMLGQYAVGKPLLWIGVAAAFVVAGRTIVRQEKLRLTIVAVQFAFYLLAYMVTPHDLAWHVRWSWERLVSHLAFLLAFAAISGLLSWIKLVERPEEGDLTKSDGPASTLT